MYLTHQQAAQLSGGALISVVVLNFKLFFLFAVLKCRNETVAPLC